MKNIKTRLPNFFAINQATDLVRIGRNYDGGYLISKSDIEKSIDLNIWAILASPYAFLSTSITNYQPIATAYVRLAK